MIKELEAGDFSRVNRLLRDYWKERGLNFSHDWMNNYLREGHKVGITDDKTFVLRDKELVGVISVIFYGDLAELRDFVIRPIYRNKGYGRKLVEYVLDLCKKNRIRKIFVLCVIPQRKIWEAFGFVNEGVLKDHFKDGEDMLIMSYKIKYKKEKQVNLGMEFKKIEIEKKTSEQLMKLRSD